MPISTITYSDKSDINVNSSVPSTNKVQAIDMNEIKNVVNNNADVTNGLKGTILWTNPNPNSSFEGQTITLSSDDYDMLLFIYRTDLTITNCHSEFIIKGFGGQFDFFSTAVENRRWARRFAWISNTQFTFQDAWYYDGNSSTQQNSNLIPLYVIGYKTELF